MPDRRRPTLALRCARLAFCCATLAPAAAFAQLPDLAPAKPSPASLFKNQCGTCHVLNAADGPRQGPPLGGVVGRKPGSAPEFKYTEGYAHADFVWDAPHLDEYLANPQALIPGSVMAYKQADPEKRAAIIGYLEEQK